MRHVAMFVVVALAAGGGAALLAVPSDPGAGFTEGIELAASRAHLGMGTDSPFNFLALRDLWVRVNVARMPRTAALNLVLTSPRGEDFYETTLYFSRDPKLRSVTPEGSNRPVAVHPSQRRQGGYSLDQAIPIAGSVFLRYPMPGTWSVRATLSGVEETLTTTLEVEVTP